jgi:hypothetical protein
MFHLFSAWPSFRLVQDSNLLHTSPWMYYVTDRPNSASTQRTTYNVQPTTYHLQRTNYNVQPTTYRVHYPKHNVLLSTPRLPTPLPGYTVPNTMGHSHCPRHNVQHTMCCPFPSYPSVHNGHHTMWTHNVITHCDTRSTFSISTSIYSWPIQPVCTTPLSGSLFFPKKNYHMLHPWHLRHPTTSHYSTLELLSSPSRSASRLHTKHFPLSISALAQLPLTLST